MRFVRYTADTSPQWGVEHDSTLHPLSRLPGGPPDLSDLANPSYRTSVRRALRDGALPSRSPDDVRRLAPVPQPGQIVCVGLNYHDHAEEQNEEVPERPLLFAKSPSAVTNPGDPIVHPAGIDEVDYEVELGIVIGRTARNVDAADAREYVAGYTIINDVSARDAQFDDGQFFRGKSYDTFAPMGPALVTDHSVDPNTVDVELRVNGEVKQSSSTEEFIFDVDEVVEYISGVTTLRPGDVISTGTPGGVGIFRDPPDLLEPGDTVEAEIEGIGILENSVVAADGDG
jgi:2-keto-4-pentenoate hydratase/2-oxohepta-3-ene-1,7-dioic acid hydratase in catechol pathway